MGLRAVVLGASGYSGGELLRLLEGHPSFEVAAAAGASRAGEAVAAVHPHLAPASGVLVSAPEGAATDADVCFSCLPSGELAAFETAIAADVVIDLSDDHRADEGWIYGLTEFARDRLVGARAIANPGCYPTATLLCTVPFVRAGVATEELVVDAMSGVSGAGRRREDRLLFATQDGAAGAYGSTSHRHVPEMERYLAAFAGEPVKISFTPHLIPVTRGLLVTARARLTGALTDEQANGILHDAFSKEPFVHVVDGWPVTKAVAGSNGAHVSAHVDERNGWIVCSAAIDNLGKGAAGQAVQNANVLFGLEETLGLSALGVWP